MNLAAGLIDRRVVEIDTVGMSATGRLCFGPPIDAMLDRLYTLNASQDGELATYFTARAAEGSLDWNSFDERTNQFLKDKLVAFDRTKAEFCYHLCRALQARRIVEAGTSYGVSTLYLAAAVRDNLATNPKGSPGMVIGTEFETEKARIARSHFTEAGLANLIDLREGDLRETLKNITGPIDFLLLDIWTFMARPALELVAPHLRAGAVIIADNTAQFREAYDDYFEFVNDPKNGLRTMTLPFEGGLEFTVRAR